MFLNKTSRTGTKLEALEARIQELRERVEDREKSIKEKQEEAGRFLAEVAINETSENQENLKSARKSIEKMKETLEESQMMLTAALLERDRLKIEMCEATIRESPAQLESLAKDFNNLLDEGLTLLDAIDTLHNKLKSMQDNFHTILNRRQNSLSQVGRIEGLVISEGLGRLSQISGPHRQFFDVPVTADKFIASLKAYKQALYNCEKFQQSNPSFDADVEKIRERDKESSKFDRYILRAKWSI